MSVVRSTVISFAFAVLAFMPVSARALCPPIASVAPFSNVTPGGYVLLYGTSFGNVPGKLEILLTEYQGTPLLVEMDNVVWTNNWIQGVIPFWLAEVENQTAVFLAEFQALQVPMCVMAHAPFTATTDYNIVSPLGAVNCDTTGPIGSSDYCGWGQWTYPVECLAAELLVWPPPWSVPGPVSFWAYHASGFGGGSGVQSDTWKVSLNNGWVFDEVAPFWVETFSLGGTWAGIWTMSNPGTSNPSIQVNWRSDACGQVVYWADIWIEGPALVPY
jgi:hypothetical protein